ncbi:MAG: iron ABC transporter permease [Candidatus Methanomethylophilaceae archaeon]|nr:iron ABC transporter permease [Candidatus Methanomethylophilaceae archaeon]
MTDEDIPIKSNFQTEYRKLTTKRIGFIAVCAVACLLLSIYAATVGSYPISSGDVFNSILDAILGRTPEDYGIYHIVVNLRMPAIVTALVCGFGLAIAGVCMQSMLKNPLADPYTMGISSGAGFGAALAMILGIEIIGGAGTVANAFVFAILPAMVILFLSKFRNATPTMMILCGIALMYLFNAATQLFMLIADPEDLSAVYKWMIGSVDGTSMDEAVIVLIVAILGTIYVQYMSNQLNLMGLGDESAKTLGVDVERKRLILLIVVTLVAATVVSFTGIIGFIGLVAPHMVRAIIGTDNKYLIPASGFFGAFLLLLSHLVAMTIAQPTVLPVGVITSCIGGPLFLFLILRNSKEVWA